MDVVVLARLVAAASRGRVPVEMLACPHGGPESVVHHARGTWSAARQEMEIGDVDEIGHCSKRCGARLVEDTTFLIGERVIDAVRKWVDKSIDSKLDRHAVAFECARCGSETIDLAVTARRNPIFQTWDFIEVGDFGHQCQACGSPACQPLSRPLRAAERKRAEFERRRAAKQHAKDLDPVRRMLGYVTAQEK